MCCQPRRLFWAMPPARMMWRAPFTPPATKIGLLIGAFTRCSVPCPAIGLATFDLVDVALEDSNWEIPDVGLALATNISARFDPAGLEVEAAPEATVSTTLVEV